MMKKILNSAIASGVLVACLSLPLVAGAQNVNPPSGGGQFDNPLQVKSIQELVALILDIIVQIGAVVAVFFLIYAGFLFVTARGNATKLETAKKAFIGVCIGVVILLGAQALADVLRNTVKQITGTDPLKGVNFNQ